jgi:myosin heavy subunit
LKNNDDVPQDLTALLQTSNDSFVQSYVGSLQAASAMATSGGGAGRRSSIRKQSIADGFVQSMASLVKTLNDTTCSFIRCIKPNAEMKAISFNNLYSLEQIRALGLVQVCGVMKIGLPTRISFPELKEALGPVALEAEALFAGHPQETFIASLLYAFNIPQDVYQLGRTKLFFKSGQLEALDRILSTDFIAQKDQIMERLNAALKARNDCEEAVKAIHLAYEDVQKSYENTQQAVMSLSTSLIDVREHVVKAFIREYHAVSSLTEKLLDLLNTLTGDIRDVMAYGRDVQQYTEPFQPIQKRIALVQEKLSISESQWNVLDGYLAEIAHFVKEDPNNEMYILCAERSDELPRIETEILEAKELVHLVELQANRCDVSKVQQKSDDAEHEMSLIRYHLKKVDSGLIDIEKIKKQTVNKVEDMKLHLIDVKKFIHQSGAMATTITDLCTEIRVEIDTLRTQIAKDLEEKKEWKRKLEKEKRRRRKEEKKKNERYLLKWSVLVSSSRLVNSVYS